MRQTRLTLVGADASVEMATDQLADVHAVPATSDLGLRRLRVVEADECVPPEDAA